MNSLSIIFVNEYYKEKLGWKPEITAQQMCKEMVEADLQEARQDAFLKANGSR
jgi:GDPmannose 4,6-dehydratase